MRAIGSAHKPRVVGPGRSFRVPFSASQRRTDWLLLDDVQIDLDLLHSGHAQQACRAHKVDFEMLDGRTASVEVEEGDNLLDAMIEAGLEPTHDCKMGVCMTCPARVTSGKVEQAAAMLSDDVRDKGYALMCVAEPVTDCTVKEITEAEILDEQLCA